MEDKKGTFATVKEELNIFDSLKYQVTHLRATEQRIPCGMKNIGTDINTPLIFEAMPQISKVQNCTCDASCVMAQKTTKYQKIPRSLP